MCAAKLPQSRPGISVQRWSLASAKRKPQRFTLSFSALFSPPYILTATVTLTFELLVTYIASCRHRPHRTRTEFGGTTLVSGTFCAASESAPLGCIRLYDPELHIVWAYLFYHSYRGVMRNHSHRSKITWPPACDALPQVGDSESFYTTFLRGTVGILSLDALELSPHWDSSSGNGGGGRGDEKDADGKKSPNDDSATEIERASVKRRDSALKSRKEVPLIGEHQWERLRKTLEEEVREWVVGAVCLLSRPEWVIQIRSTLQ